MKLNSQESDVEPRAKAEPGQPTAKSRPLWTMFVNLVLLSVSFGLLVAFYVLGVTQISVHKRIQYPLDEASLGAARELAKVTVSHPDFGVVGLVDSAYPDRARRPAGAGTTGINTLFATLRLDALIASRLKNRFVADLVARDLKEAQGVKSELSRRLRQAVSQDTYIKGGGRPSARTIYEQIYRQLASKASKGAENLVSLRVELGTVKAQKAACLTVRPRSGELFDSQDFARGRYYKPGVMVPVPGGTWVTFVPISDRVELIDPADFAPCGEDTLPSAIFVEAMYSSQQTGRTDRQGVMVKRVACALVGAPPLSPPGSAFMVAFPHGLPPNLNSVADLLSPHVWTAAGRWQQAIAGEVPGAGSLGPLPGGELLEMSPDKAVAMALYHWLRQMGPEVNPDSFESLITSAWPVSPPAGAGGPGQARLPELKVNSCLARETGAREYALLNQTGPASVGQEALKNAFAGVPSARTMPQTALPLLVDRSGRVNLPGGSGFDKRLVEDFLACLYDTNLAGVESHSVCAALIDRIKREMEQAEEEQSLKVEEMRSISVRLSRMRTPARGSDADRQGDLLRARLEALNAELSRADDNRAHRRRLKDLCTLGLINAQKASLNSFEICSRLSLLAQDGLKRVDEPPGSFLVGEKLIFVPHRKPVSEQEILLAGSLKTPAPVSEWLSPGFVVVRQAGTPAGGQGRPGAAAAGSQADRPRAFSMFVVLSSGEARVESPGRPAVYGDSPFGNVPVPEGQLVYYCSRACSAGGTPAVGWSLLVRDLVAFRFGEAGGEPRVSDRPGWCAQASLPQGACPGLAAEVQIRSPLPEHVELGAEASLVNPLTGDRVSPYPPVSPGMI